MQWSSPSVYVPVITAAAFAIGFVVFELYIAPEPVLAPFLLRERIPVLVGISNFLVALCNFTVMYNFPTWFQTVLLTSASEAGLFFLDCSGRVMLMRRRRKGAHLIPNGISVSLGSLFAGYVIRCKVRHAPFLIVGAAQLGYAPDRQISTPEPSLRSVPLCSGYSPQHDARGIAACTTLAQHRAYEQRDVYIISMTLVTDSSRLWKCSRVADYVE